MVYRMSYFGLCDRRIERFPVTGLGVEPSKLVDIHWCPIAEARSEVGFGFPYVRKRGPRPYPSFVQFTGCTP